jgi:pyruvate kinase
MAKRTKIVATIGPASEDRETLKKMIQNGMNVARFNFSHGDYKWHGKIMRMIKELERELDIPVGMLADLQGPRIRIMVKNDIGIDKGEIILVGDISSDKKTITKSPLKSIILDYPGIVKSLKKENDILIEDGLIRLKVIKKIGDIVQAEVIDGGVVKNHKGVNIPGAKVRMNVLTEKDKKDLAFALKQEADFIALSFVSNAKDINNLRKLIKKLKKNPKELPQIIAKIERREAIKNFDEILRATDGVMVARGDLGIEMEESRVAVYQKEIVEKSLRSAKPVIVATQMLNSMIENPRPTRAEVSDVSNAVVDHADAVMLSGETANGKYPAEAVKIMRDIIERTEESPFDDLVHGFLGDSRSSVSSAVANSAHELSKDSGAKAIIVASISGITARMISRHRPEQMIYVMTNNPKTYYQLTLLWGTESFILPNCKNLDELIARSIDTLKKKKLIKKSDRIVIVTGRPHVKKEHMSLVKVEEIR